MVKWAGGKSWLVPVLSDFYRQSDTDAICEPFAGGMALSLHVRPRMAYINDLNEHLINLYSQIRFGFLRTRPNWWFCDEQHYYNVRDRFNYLIKNGKSRTEEAAQCFWYINQYGFNGLCRFNRKGECNVPWGGVRNPASLNIDTYRSAFGQWQFSAVDFRRLFIRPRTFVYCDPPYEMSFSAYNGKAWTFEDFKQLVEWGASLDNPVFISNVSIDPVVEVLEAYNYSYRFVDGPRRISRDGNRKPVREILAWHGL